MSVDPASYYNNGMSWKEFLEAARENADRMQGFYDDFDFDEDTLAFFNGRTPLQVLAIAEEWCPDVVQCLAMIARIADEVPGMELSIARRDENPDLMKEYITEGKHRIPVIAFFDMTFRELGRWAGRCESADQWVFNEVLGGKQFEDLDEKEVAAFDTEYDKRFRETYARETLEEWQRLLEDQDY